MASGVPDPTQIETVFEEEMKVLDQQINSSQSNLDMAFSQGKELQALNLQQIKNAVTGLEKQIQFYEFQRVDLLDQASKAEEIGAQPDKFEEKFKGLVLGKAWGIPTFSNESTDLSKMINNWLNEVAGKEASAISQILIGPKESIPIYEAFPQYFEGFKAVFDGTHKRPGDIWFSLEAWHGVAIAYEQEAEWRANILSQLYVKLLQLQMAKTQMEYTPLSQLPNQEQIDYWTNLKNQLQNTKGHVQKTFENNQRYAQKHQEYVNGWKKAAIDQGERFPDKQVEEDAQHYADMRLQEDIVREIETQNSAHQESDRVSIITPASPVVTKSTVPTDIKTREGQEFIARAEKQRNTFKPFYHWFAKSALGQLFGRRVGVSGEEEQVSSSSQSIQQPIATAAGGQAVGEVGAMAGGVAKLGLNALLSKGIDAALGLIAPELLAVKKIIDAASKLIPRELREAFADFMSNVKKAIGGLAAYLAINLPATISGLIGGALGGLLGPAGAAAGFATGFAVGVWVVQPLFGWGTISTASAATLPVSSVITGSTAGTGILGSASAFLGGGTAPVAIGVGGLAGTAMIVVIGTGAAFAGNPTPPPVGQQGKAAFTVEKTGDPSFLPNYKPSDTQIINYSIKINLGADDIKIDKISDKRTIQKDAGEIDKGTIDLTTCQSPCQSSVSADGKSWLYTYTYTISGSEFQDSTFQNTVTVEATNNTTHEKESQQASFVVWINKKPVHQPFGFPSTGTIFSLDWHYGSYPASQFVHWSCFWVIEPVECHADAAGHLNISGRSAIIGGIDISGTAGTPVKSTLDGKVIYAEYRPQDVGGVVYVRNCANDDCTKLGSYVAEFEHLNSPEVSTGIVVHRGTQIGTTVGAVPAISGPHVHYQIILITSEKDGKITGGSNVSFMDKNNAGKCSEGKIEPDFNDDLNFQKAFFDYATFGFPQMHSQYIVPPCT